MKKKGILERLKEGPVLGDGGYLLELEKRGWVRAGPFTPEVALMYPNALRELHVEFREAGSEVLQALTFYASRDKLATVGLEDRLEELNRSAVRVAREVAGRMKQVLVRGGDAQAGSVIVASEVNAGAASARGFDHSRDLGGHLPINNAGS